MQREAEDLLPARAEAAEQATGLRPRRLRIRYMKSQWGSCTSRGNVCLNSALVYLPNELIDYVIIHELCHLKYLNHSARFWQLVAKHAPDYQQLRRQLRPYRIGLVINRPVARAGD